jgi:hypothetical protein
MLKNSLSINIILQIRLLSQSGSVNYINKHVLSFTSWAHKHPQLVFKSHEETATYYIVLLSFLVNWQRLEVVFPWVLVSNPCGSPELSQICTYAPNHAPNQCQISLTGLQTISKSSKPKILRQKRWFVAQMSIRLSKPMVNGVTLFICSCVQQ